MVRLLLLFWVGLGIGCIQAPPQSPFESQDMSDADMGSDSGQEDTGVLPTCGDGVKNQDETGVDCGGTNCAECGLGEPCEADMDCQSSLCVAGVCSVQDGCLVSDLVTPQAAYDSGCSSIQFPEGDFELPFNIERTVELSGAGEDTRLGKVVLKGATEEVRFHIAELTFKNLQEGAIEHIGGSLSLADVRFEGNSNGDQGGAIYSEFTGESRLDVVNCNFESNTADRGGAIYAIYPAESGVGQSEHVSIVSSNFKDNTVGTAGGAIFIQGASALIADSTFFGNKAIDGESGGAIHVEGVGVGSLRIQASSFIQSAVSSSGVVKGGAISIREQTLQITQSYFEQNQAEGLQGLGGAIAGDNASIVVTQTTFLSNGAAGTMGTARGAAIHAQGFLGSLTLINSTLSGQQINGANSEGGAVYLSGRAFGSYSNTFAGNEGPSVVVEPLGQGSEISRTDNTIFGDSSAPVFPEGFVWSGRNIVANPLATEENQFIVGDPELGGIKEVNGTWVHEPGPNSIARGDGDCIGPDDSALETDQLEEPRPGGSCTVGAVQ